MENVSQWILKHDMYRIPHAPGKADTTPRFIYIVIFTWRLRERGGGLRNCAGAYPPISYPPFHCFNPDAFSPTSRSRLLFLISCFNSFSEKFFCLHPYPYNITYISALLVRIILTRLEKFWKFFFFIFSSKNKLQLTTNY